MYSTPQNRHSNISERIHRGSRRTTGLVAFASVIGLCCVFANDPAAPAGGTKLKEAGRGQLPEGVGKLKLSNEQETKIQEIAKTYDNSIALVWSQFREQYMRTIGMETSMLAAIEDHLTDEQRQQIRDSRRKLALHESTDEKSDKKSSDPTGKPAQVMKQELKNTGVELTSEQMETAEGIQSKYRPHLRKLSQQIHELHKKLISLESEKLVAIEKELTSDQLNELRTNRREATDIPGVAHHQSEHSKKAE